MTTAEIEDRFWASLHKSIGICGHCGKRQCAGKASSSILPTSLPFSAVKAAITDALATLGAEEKS